MVPPRPPVPERKVGPTREEALLVWRAWSLECHDGEWKLGAVGMAFTWEPGVNEACHVKTSCGMYMMPAEIHDAPEWGCNCGFWGCPTLDEAQTSITRSGLMTPAHIWGTALLWGRVVQHEHGFRASRGQVVGLLKPQKELPNHIDGDVPEQIAERYGIPLVAEPWMLGG